jgi:hypothetical protein
MLSDHQISALCQASTKSKSSRWNSKENEFTLQKIFWGNSERENQAGHYIQNLKACIGYYSWFFKKMEYKGLSGSNSVWHSIRFGHRTSCSCRWPFDWRGWGTRRRLWVLCQFFSVDHNREEWIRCAKYFRWAHTLWAGVEEDFVCESCQG